MWCVVEVAERRASKLNCAVVGLYEHKACVYCSEIYIRRFPATTLLQARSMGCVVEVAMLFRAQGSNVVLHACEKKKKLKAPFSDLLKHLWTCCLVSSLSKLQTTPGTLSTIIRI